MTELYRLQRQQTEADLDSEELESVEVGWKFRGDSMSLDLALFTMNKDNVILRETNGFNVSNGSTRHRGLEYQLELRPLLGDVMVRRPLPAHLRGTSTRSRAPSRAAKRSSRATTWTRRRATSTRSDLEVPLGRAR